MATEQVTWMLRAYDDSGREWELAVTGECDIDTVDIEGTPVTQVGKIKITPDAISGRIVAE